MTTDTTTDPTTFLGYRRHTKNRASGTLIVLVDAEEQGISAEDGGKWALICHDHGYLLQDDVQSILIPHMAWPDWCEECQAIIHSKNP